MTRLTDVCRYVRSKNAGPFWITVDLFFKDRESFDRWIHSPSLQAEGLARHLGIDEATLRLQPLPELSTLKFSYPRRVPQGGRFERDMHGGQQYVQLLRQSIEPAA